MSSGRYYSGGISLFSLNVSNHADLPYPARTRCIPVTSLRLHHLPEHQGTVKSLLSACLSSTRQQETPMQEVVGFLCFIGCSLILSSSFWCPIRSLVGDCCFKCLRVAFLYINKPAPRQFLSNSKKVGGAKRQRGGAKRRDE